MKKFLAIFAIVGLIVAVPVISYITNYNKGNQHEQQIQGIWENNEGILAQYYQKVQEAAQIPGMQKEDMLEVFTGAIEARYGKQGSQATFQWIQEQNPNLDATVYKQLMQIIEAGRNEFRINQTRMVDAKRAYRQDLGSFWSGMWLKITGYPTINVGYPINAKDDYPVISTTEAQNTFKEGLEKGPLQLRKDNK